MIVFVLLALAVLMVLVLGHEFGHFIMARRNGVEVEEFAFGFPPRLFSVKRGETQYSFNLLPLGGYVKLKGEGADDTTKGSIGGASFWAQTKIFLGGVAMNFIIAYVILVALCASGLPPIGPDPIKLGHPSFSQLPHQVIADVSPGSPAAGVGLVAGDSIWSADGRALKTSDDLMRFTRDHAGQVVSLNVTNRGQRRDLNVKLRDPGSDNGYLGVVPVSYYEQRFGLWSPVVALVTLVQIIGLTFAGLWHFLLSLPLLFGHVASRSAVETGAAGPVGIIYFLRNIQVFGAAPVILIIMNISVALGAFNLLPLPALDGGRWAFLAAQRAAKRRMSQALETRIHLAGFALLLLLGILITINDLKRF